MMFEAQRWRFTQRIICRGLKPHYAAVVERLRERIARNEPIRVGFFVTMDSIFPLQSLFERMLDDPFFEPYIIVAPPCTYDKEFEIENGRRTWETLVKRYGEDRVWRGFDWETNTYHDYSPRLDMVGFNYPYHVVHPYFYVSYLYHESVLMFSADYGFYLSRTHCQEYVMKTFFMHSLWKYYASSPWFVETARKVMFNKAENLELTGFVRMDAYKPAPPKEEGEPKVVIIAPHHSMCDQFSVQFSNFLEYAELFQRLPEMYPQIHFVFRPHPYLLKHLVKMGVWTQNQTDDYMARLAAHPNMEISLGGNHLDLFARSDGMIQDCVSFLAEYYYTGKPQCYMLRDQGKTEAQLSDLGCECLRHTYPAYREQDILDFLDHVILEGNDSRKAERDEFAAKNITLNWPHVAEKIISSIKSNLGVTSEETHK
ncbi:MAG: CDP-glycerol glycerophosphotransferase family protein [Thermoguttaceae bacterium]|nr:CDP-glycerol glycerophosphotransferase family protein [Thermoguttaceae bacterium]